MKGLFGNSYVDIVMAICIVVCQMLGVPLASMTQEAKQLQEEAACLDELWAAMQKLRATDTAIATVLNGSEKAAAAAQKAYPDMDMGGAPTQDETEAWLAAEAASDDSEDEPLAEEPSFREKRRRVVRVGVLGVMQWLPCPSGL